MILLCQVTVESAMYAVIGSESFKKMPISGAFCVQGCYWYVTNSFVQYKDQIRSYRSC
jgi:hypothetical protein